MQTLRRYWYIFLLLFILFFVSLSLLLVGWKWDRFLLPPRSLSSRTGVIPSRTVGTLPPTYRPGAHLIIPAIGVNTSIEPVGLLADGDLAVPAQKPWETAGWYQYGPYPGDPGSAVIDGHLDRPGGLPAVFWNLRNLHVGDSIMVVNPGEKPLHFRVRNIEYYTPNNAPLPTIFGNTTGTFLNLITCAGQWIPTQHQTTLRLVIYTTLV
jgi:hypothetical protein